MVVLVAVLTMSKASEKESPAMHKQFQWVCDLIVLAAVLTMSKESQAESPAMHKQFQWVLLNVTSYKLHHRSVHFNFYFIIAVQKCLQ